MKKISLFIISILAAILMVSCTTNTEKVKVLVPTGTPSLGVSYALDKEEYIEEEIVSGSWLLHLVLLFYCCFGKWLCSAGSDADALLYKDSSTSENISCNLPKWILL